MYEKYVVNVAQETGYTVSDPYKRTVKHIFAPDLRNVKQLTFSHITIPPGSKTDNHTHDRGELIYVISGYGRVSMGEEVYDVELDFALWVPKGVKHELKNTGKEAVKIITLFVPAYKSSELKSKILDPSRKTA